MTTNILCKLIIALVTNVVSSDNAQWGPARFFVYPEGGGPPELIRPATEKYTTTTVEEVATIHWLYQGADGQAQVWRKMLSSVTEIMRLKQEWESVGRTTNEWSIAPWVVTNNFITVHDGTLTNISFGK